MRPLLRELLDYLSGDGVDEQARTRAEAVVFDQLEPVSVTPISAPLPADARARRVAETLLLGPADAWQLAEFGRAVGASARHLARLVLDETGLSFGRWRTQARLRFALPWLADGAPLAGVAERVGYASPSAFLAAFRREVGISPGAYFGR